MRETFVVGNRVSVGGHFATLRFIGELEDQSGTWFGIEWDEKERGKHKGDYKGKSYFTCQDPSGSASFVREKHLKRGIGVLEAISIRYMPIGKIDDSPDVVNFFNMGGKEIQFYNRSKDGKCHVPKDQAWNLYQTDLDLSAYPVSFLEGGPAHLSSIFPRVTYVNISKTLIEDINVPLQILTGLHNLKSINISFNQFRVKTPDYKCLKQFPRVQKFHCDAVNLTFEEFVKLTDLFPNLITGSFALNRISTLSVPPKGSLEKLEKMALQQCELSDWAEVQKLAHLPNLQMINLLDNKIKRIDVPHEQSQIGFAYLRMLIVAGNKIENWKDFSRLAFLPKLSNLLLYENPLCDLNVQRFRDEIISRLPHLQLFNKTDILKEERKSASILYIKLYYDDWLKAGGLNTPENLDRDKIDKSFMELHPTYFDLFKKIGDGIVPTNNTNDKIKSQLLKVHIVSRMRNAKGEISDEKTLSQIKLLSSMTVGKIKLLISRLLKVAASHPMELSYRPHQHPDSEYSLESDLKTLSFYSVEDTDTIVVELPL